MSHRRRDEEASARGREEETNRRSSRVVRVGVRTLDALVYAATVTGLVVIGVTVASFTFGGGWPGVKVALFLIGTLLFGYATFRLRPAPAWKRSQGVSRSSIPREAETRFQRLVGRVPPLRWIEVEPAETAAVPTKLFLSSLAILAVSYAMEAIFGVGG